jgi:hypothetical protein
MQMNVRHVHADIDNGMLMCGLELQDPQATSPELFCQVLAELILIMRQKELSK